MSDPAGALHQPPTVVLGRYEVLKRLASGGMGEIYLARQVAVAGFERLVILKSILPDLADDPSMLSQFLDEARVVATLNHPSVVSVIEVAEWQGGYLLAMEYIQGVDLARLLREARKINSPVPVRVAAGIMREAAAGLDYAHHAVDSQGRPLCIVHRDISPQNLMVRPDGVVKIVDFGIAAAANRLARTQGDTVKGKLRYMAPEQMNRGPLDGRCDQWSLGVVFWEMLVGEGLFRGETPFELAAQITQKPIPPPSSLRPDVSTGLDNVVLRMLERDPAKRFAACGEVVHALDRFLFDSGGPAGTVVGGFVTRVAGATVNEKTRDLSASTPPAAPPAPAATAALDPAQGSGLDPTERQDGAALAGLLSADSRAASLTAQLDAVARAAHGPVGPPPTFPPAPPLGGMAPLGGAPMPPWANASAPVPAAPPGWSVPSGGPAAGSPWSSPPPLASFPASAPAASPPPRSARRLTRRPSCSA